MRKLNFALRVVRCIAVAFAKAGSAALLGPQLGTLAANGLVEAVPAVAKELWQAFRRPPAEGGMTPGELRIAMTELATADNAEAEQLAIDAISRDCATVPQVQREALLAVLREVPATLRQSLRRPEDPTGRTVPAYQSFERPEDLAIMLPRRVSRMQPGQVMHGLALVRLLGSGGYGEVWEAVPKGIPGAEPVAIKFCTDERARRQLLDHEAKVVAQVMRIGRHPGIVRLQRCHLDDDVPALEYEFVAGGDLQAYLTAWWKGGKPYGVDDAVALFVEIVAPFAHMHAAKPPIVHRDAKLANILVDAQGRVRVTDFGIGGLAFVGDDVALSRRGAVSVGQFSAVARGAYTPHYASREQMDGEDPHPADDVYSLGVIFYQLLTKRMGEGAPTGDWQDDLRESSVSEPVIDVLKKALARSRERRFADGGVLLAAVGELGRGISEKVAATPSAPLVARSAKPILTGIGLKMIYVPPQEFLMGSPVGESGRRDDEQQHRVKITRGYWLGETEVTQKQWRAVMGTAPWQGERYVIEGDDVAATYVSWNDAVEFCRKLTETERTAGRLPDGYRYILPTEAEWELACRAGSRTAYCFGDSVEALKQFAVFDAARSGGYAHAVKSRKANDWGFFDMHGNVWEWCLDECYYQSGSGVVTSTYSYRDGVDPYNTGGPRRLRRGGSWLSSAQILRSSLRRSGEPGFVRGDLGLRPALAARSDVK